ncbi:MAG: hypothetical protein AMXMBFR82_29600 [Candidatus Hydrogenedentota bacterium]
MNGAIRSKVIERLDTLPEDLQRKVLAYVQTLQSEERRGVSGDLLLMFAGTIPQDDLLLMKQAIEDGCEQVDENEW